MEDFRSLEQAWEDQQESLPGGPGDPRLSEPEPEEEEEEQGQEEREDPYDLLGGADEEGRAGEDPPRVEVDP